MFSTARAASTAYLEFNHYSMQFIGIIIIHYSELVITFALQVVHDYHSKTKSFKTIHIHESRNVLGDLTFT